MKIVSLPAALASTLLLAAPALAAQPVAAFGDWAMHESKADISAFQKTKTSLADAITAAEKHTGGKALDISFEIQDGRHAYRVRTYQNDEIWAGMIDADSGQVIGKGATTPGSKFDRRDKAEVAELKKAPISLWTAIATAEKQLSGKAIGGGMEDIKGRLTYEAQVVTNGAIHRATVDPMSGGFTSLASS